MGQRGPMPGMGGRPPKALAEKIANGNPGNRPLKRLSMPSVDDIPDLLGVDVPEPKSYMTQTQKGGTSLCAEEVFEETWDWLKERGCEKLVNTQLLRQYAMSVSRWVQCEEAVSNYGFLAKHPTTGQAIASPYVAMGQNFMKQANQQWNAIIRLSVNIVLRIMMVMISTMTLWSVCSVKGWADDEVITFYGTLPKSTY